MTNSHRDQPRKRMPMDGNSLAVRAPWHHSGTRIALAATLVAGLVLMTAPIGSATASPVGAFGLFDTPDTSSAPEDIAKGSDGNMWFTERVGNRISRITPAGVITEFEVPNRSLIARRNNPWPRWQHVVHGESGKQDRADHSKWCGHRVSNSDDQRDTA